jgi:ribonucleoside-diphosphate reductase alpha chain
VSYLSRFDLAHVDPNESGFDALGKGVGEGKSPEEAQGTNQATKYLSRGLTRSRTDNLVVMRGANTTSTSKSDGPKMAYSAPQSKTDSVIEGAVALKQETEHDLSPTEKLHGLQWSKAGAAMQSKAERRAEAKAKGYEGEMCSECGSFTLVRNGTCMKCDTCGSTTGCS